MKRLKAAYHGGAGAIASIFLLSLASHADAQRPARCQDARLPVYFERQSAAIDQTSTVALASALQSATDCRVVSATLVGRGDATGPGRGDQGLARRRAEAVAVRLREAGVSNTSISLITRPGQAGAGSILERRVTVHLHRTSR